MYVLHAFQKKSKTGIAAPKAGMELVKRRLKRAKELNAAQEKRDFVERTGNVFADPGLPQPDEALDKAELAQKIVAILHERQLTQMDAAAILGIDQPRVSTLMRGRLSGFSFERQLRFCCCWAATLKLT